MKNYEIMFIVRPTLGEEEIKEVVKNFENILVTNGGKITNFKEYGKRDLAYEINNFKSGYYFLFNVETKNSKAVDEFNRLSLISKEIIRHLITNIE
ncbi:MAG TPA: 30S ribosomal protein S6 [Mollicutes bacterium]|jgi:small subunit ribosomal protein S6|nr:30S ribosomal protein S6 [Mollicutes bacterium]